MTKQNMKYVFILIIVGVLFYRFTERPQLFYDFFAFIWSLFRPFFMGMLLAVLLNPIVKWLEEYLKFPRSLSILCTYGLGLIFIVICCLLVIPSFIVGISDLFVKMSAYLSIIEEENWLYQFMQNTPYIEDIIFYIQSNIYQITKNIMTLFNSLSTSLLMYMMGLASEIVNWFFGITISIYLIIDQKKVLGEFEQFLMAYVPKYKHRIIYFVRFTYRTFQEYMIGRLFDSLIIGLIAFVGFSLLKTPYIPLFAFIIFITNIIPYFGPIIGAILPIFMTLLINPIQAIWVTLFIVLLQQLDGNVIGPKIMGDRVGLSPLWVVSVVILGGAMFGFVGFFLAVPISAVIKEVYDLLIRERLERLK